MTPRSWSPARAIRFSRPDPLERPGWRGQAPYLGRPTRVLPCCAHQQCQPEGSRKMRSNRRKNWFIKRIALGLAIAAFAAPVAQAKVDECSTPQARAGRLIVEAHTYQPV